MNTACTRRLFPRSTWVTISFGLLVLIFATHPALLGRFSTHFIGGTEGDGGLYVWLAESFHESPWSALLGESFTFYPYPASRAWSDSFILPSAVVSLLLHCGVPLTISYNLLVIAAILLNGLAVAALCRVLSMQVLPCFLAAVFFSCSSYFTGNFGHPQLLFFFWIPFAWACVLSAINQTPHDQGLWRYVAAGLCVSASFYCAVYYSIFAVLGLGYILLLRSSLSRQGVTLLAKRGFALALGMLPILWMLPTYLRVVDAFGSRRLYEADAFAASGLSYFSLPPHNLLWGFSSSLTHNEATLGVGVIALVAATISVVQFLRSTPRVLCTLLVGATAVALCASSVIDQGIASELTTAISAWLITIAAAMLAMRSRNVTACLFATIALFFVLSLGPAGNPTKGEPALAPFALLHTFVPGLDSMRAVSRFGSVVVMGLCIAAAQGLSALLRRSNIISSGIVALLVAAVLLENYTPIFPLDRIPPQPLVIKTLSQHIGPNEAAIVLPFAGDLEKGRVKSWSESAILSTRYALWTSAFRIPIVNGYSGQRPKLNTELPAALADFPSASGLEWLCRICGVRWIIVIPSLFKDWNEASFRDRVAQHADRLQIAATEEDGSLLLKLDPWVEGTGPFFVRPDSKVTIELSGPLPAECALNISDLTRSPSGELALSPITPLMFGQERRISTIAPLSAPLGRARILHVDKGACPIRRRCIPD